MIKRKDRKYIALLVFLLLGLILIEYSTPKPIDWRHTYAKTDKIPYGNFLLFELLESMFAPPVTENRQTFYENMETLTKGKSGKLIIIICEDFEPDSLDANALMETVFNGGDVMIAATSFGQYLSDTLHLEVNYAFPFFQQNKDIHAVDSVGINLFDVAEPSDSTYYYFRTGTTSFHFSELDSLHTFVLGKDSDNHPNFVRVAFGQGNFWLHTNPLVFTNYNMVQENPRTYIERALSRLPQKPIIWDEYYKTGRNDIRTPLRFILSNEALKWAYYTLISIMLIFVIFQGKRRQRIIPVLSPPQNTSLEFVETIGRLYFQQKNHIDLAKKKIIFFKEHLRTYFYISTSQLGNEAVKKVAMRSGIPEEKVESLFRTIETVEQKEAITEEELQQLSEKIEAFKAKSMI